MQRITPDIRERVLRDVEQRRRLTDKQIAHREGISVAALRRFLCRQRAKQTGSH